MARKSSSSKSPKKAAKSAAKKAADRAGAATSKTAAGKIALSELRARLRDPETPIEDIRPYLKIDPERSQAFAPALTVDRDVVDDEGLEGSFTIGFFNWVSRRRRAARYRRKLRDGYSGLRIVSEGDSWFQYPLLLDDVIDHLSKDYAICSLGGAGHVLADMVAEDEMTQAIERERPDVFLISGGGNDLLGDGMLKTVLKPFQSGRPAEEYLNRRFEEVLSAIEENYTNVFDRFTRRFPRLKIFCHGYDYAIPDDGPWLGKPMQALKIKEKDLQTEIVAVLIDRFNEMLAGLAAGFSGTVRHVDCRGLVGAGSWHDELHPNNNGYKTVATRINSAIHDVISGAEVQPAVQPLCPGQDHMLTQAKDLAPDIFRRIVARRARAVAGVTPSSLDDEDERQALEGEVRVTHEKLHMGADFLPARFLDDGARRARAVCRIAGPGFVGSGFLVASRQFIMTNHHVLDEAAIAQASVAEFGFEEGGETVRVPLDPARFFINDEQLDFAIVACDGDRLADVDPIPLLRNPATVTRGERVNIIQHPRGRPKEIAIHENKVERLLDLVVRYRTDTEPGSSGSPVFNNTWDLVALHHAGVAQGRTAMNEGIRMAAIVAHLVGRNRRESGQIADGVAELLDLVPDSSPLLGFFDTAGVEPAPDRMREVEVPDFRGTRDFVDLGFWNIEHFNAGISGARVDRAATVLDRLNMDIMGLTEVHSSALSRLKAAMMTRGNAVDFVLEDTPGSQDIAILFDADTTVVERADAIASRHAQALSARTPAGRTAFPRKPLFALCRVADGNSQPVEFITIVVHLKAFGDAQSRARRRLAAEILAEIIEDIRTTERLPVVIGGDFNQELNTNVLSSLSDAPDLFALTADDAVTGAASFVGDRRRSLIDHIITSRDIQPGDISGDDAAIVRLDRSVRDFASAVSDHVPVVMRMVLRDNPIDVGEPAEPAPAAAIDVPDWAKSVVVDFQS